jgi:hypothetical protein
MHAHPVSPPNKQEKLTLADRLLRLQLLTFAAPTDEARTTQIAWRTRTTARPFSPWTFVNHF